MAKSRNLWVRILFVAIILIIVVSYALFNSRSLISGPKLEITEPLNNSSFDDPVIILRGKVSNISYISLDDSPIFIDESGNFGEKLLLSPGVSIIKVYARDKFGREVTEFLNLYYTGSSTPPNEIIIDEEPTASTTEETIDED